MDLETLLHNMTLQPVPPGAGEKMDEVRAHFKNLAQELYELVPPGRQRSLMATELELACRYAIAGIVGCK